MHIFFALIFLSFLTGCTTTKFIPVESVRTDSVYITKMQRDTLMFRDSIMVERNNDTIKIEHWKTVYKVRERVDTFCKEIHDTVRINTPIINNLGKEQKKSLPLGKYLILALAGIMLFFAIYKNR